MRIYIQSKTGDYNTVIEHIGFRDLQSAARYWRVKGGYTTKRKDIQWFVPFEQIEAIREAEPNEQD